MSPAIGVSDAFGSFAQELYARYLNEVQLSKELQLRTDYTPQSCGFERRLRELRSSHHSRTVTGTAKGLDPHSHIILFKRALTRNLELPERSHHARSGPSVVIVLVSPT